MFGIGGTTANSPAVHAEEILARAPAVENNVPAIDTSSSHLMIKKEIPTLIAGCVGAWHAPCIFPQSTPCRTKEFERGGNQTSSRVAKTLKSQTRTDEGKSHAKD